MKNKLITLGLIIVSFVLGIGSTIFFQETKLAEAVSKVAKDYKKEEAGPLLPIGEFTVNLEGNTYLKTSITVEGANKDSELVIKEKEPLLKDQVLLVLSDKTLEEIKTSKARENLRQELTKKLNDVVDGNVKNVLFESFVYQ